MLTVFKETVGWLTLKEGLKVQSLVRVREGERKRQVEGTWGL